MEGNDGCALRKASKWRGKAGGRHPGGGDGRYGRLLIAALINGRATVRVLGSAPLRADAVDHSRASSRVGGRGGKECKRVFITNVKGTFFGMSESEEASKRR